MRLLMNIKITNEDDPYCSEFQIKNERPDKAIIRAIDYILAKENNEIVKKILKPFRSLPK